ncbi:MAG: S1/P1 Nuclease, partial [Alistipes sp.]|nr:S1/P1 Nuclease [Alistipes sp.]
IYATSTTGDNLSYDYVAHYAPVVEQQLLKGGLRLAKLLSEIY